MSARRSPADLVAFEFPIWDYSAQRGRRKYWRAFRLLCSREGIKGDPSIPTSSPIPNLPSALSSNDLVSLNHPSSYSICTLNRLPLRLRLLLTIPRMRPAATVAGGDGGGHAKDCPFDMDPPKEDKTN
ncbi:hypothetical protein BKA62DRAFT_772698 [Auriculariales sp. MPI-PUGE-AT-0066]|nr:hypothetical protein BKA62DRAFT_772698 [Auriculariales sp. MPI-PUGE-AT-0066]